MGWRGPVLASVGVWGPFQASGYLGWALFLLNTALWLRRRKTGDRGIYIYIYIYLFIYLFIYFIYIYIYIYTYTHIHIATYTYSL